MSDPASTYGIVAEFDSHKTLLRAASAARDRGYRRMDAYTPFPVDGMPEALGMKRTWVPLLVLIGGVIGGGGGYLMEWYANVISYPLNIGGRPLDSWPNFIPITFEMTILAAALSAFFGSLFLNRLPQPYHPIFAAPDFERASVDRFFLCILVIDPLYDKATVEPFLKELGALNVEEVSR